MPDKDDNGNFQLKYDLFKKSKCHGCEYYSFNTVARILHGFGVEASALAKTWPDNDIERVARQLQKIKAQMATQDNVEVPIEEIKEELGDMNGPITKAVKSRQRKPVNYKEDDISDEEQTENNPPDDDSTYELDTDDSDDSDDVEDDTDSKIADELEQHKRDDDQEVDDLARALGAKKITKENGQDVLHDEDGNTVNPDEYEQEDIASDGELDFDVWQSELRNQLEETLRAMNAVRSFQTDKQTVDISDIYRRLQTLMEILELSDPEHVEVHWK